MSHGKDLLTTTFTPKLSITDDKTKYFCTVSFNNLVMNIIISLPQGHIPMTNTVCLKPQRRFFSSFIPALSISLVIVSSLYIAVPADL